MFIKKKMKAKLVNNMSKPPALKEKPKEEEQILISTITSADVAQTLQKGYDAVVNGVMEDLNAMAKEYENKIMAEVKKGNWNKAQKLIDNIHPMFKVDTYDGGTKVKVSVIDYKGVKGMLAENKDAFVKEVEKVITSNMSEELVKGYYNWTLVFGSEVIEDKDYKKRVDLLIELFTKNLNEVLGIEPPKGVKPAMVASKKVPEAKKVEFADATVPKGNLPLYAMRKNDEVVIYWPGWIKEKTKGLAEVVPEKTKE